MGIKPKYTECKPPEWTEENLKAYSWCIRHGIKIGILAAAPGFKNSAWYLEITANGKKVKSPKEYDKHELWEKVFELYRFYYDKNNEQ